MSLGVFFVVRPAWSVGTRSFELDSLEKLSGGDLRGVRITSDGIVHAGWTLARAEIPGSGGTTVTSALPLADGSILVGTGPASGGKIVRFVGDQASILADTKESAVTSLAVDKGGHIAASTTSGRIYRISHGTAEVFASLPDVDTVFAIAFDKTGDLFAATGSGGRIWRIDPSGSMSIYFHADDPFVVSLSFGPTGTLFAGTSGQGLLYEITGPGSARVLYDFPADDVHSIIAGPDGSVWAAVNESASGSTPESPEAASSSSRHSSGGRAPPGPVTAAHMKPGKGSLWRVDPRGRPERLMHHDDTHYVSLALDETGKPYVGTGAEGRVYTVDNSHVVSLVVDTDERQVSGLGLTGKTRYVLGSDPAVLHRIVGVGGPDSLWTSKPLDAGLRARFGRLTFAADGSVEVSTRTGDMGTPDATWSPWSKPIRSGDAALSPAGRFFQVRARLGSASATIANISIPFVTDNLRAVVTEISAHAKTGVRDTKEGIVPSGADIPKHDSVMHATWKVDNPDGDELRFRVQFRREGTSNWIDATPADQVLTKQEIDWDTATLPEGIYRVRVDASDELSNPPDETTRHALDSAPVLIDNTPPVFKLLEVRGRRVVAEISDGIGPIARVDFAVDGRTEWRPLAPVDGIFDSAKESIDANVTDLVGQSPGPHVLALRAYDAAGNFVVREVEVSSPR